ncbi:MAG: DUF3108 domain-containing protein [Bacteroidia bacterium]|nr:DUF3108 domain-containing protein [Bacteroidia bacterium]NND53233.1 DUF3108 domain-containing protein [Flavobacteriaceae bacterium]
MKSYLLILLISLPMVLSGQNTAVGTSEKLVFTASYSMSGLLTDLAQVEMETSEVKTSTNTLLRLKCTGRTYRKWDHFFKINDLYESYVSPSSLKPYLYKKEINEGAYYKFMQYKYNYKSNSVNSLTTKRRKDGTFWDVKKDLSLGANTNDVVSTIYRIRNLDIHKAAVGSSDTFNVLFDNKVNAVTITLLGKETISTNIGEKECYKLSISISNSDVLKGNNSNLLWLTADENKIPVYAKFKVAVGSGELRIQSASGLKH